MFENIDASPPVIMMKAVLHASNFIIIKISKGVIDKETWDPIFCNFCTFLNDLFYLKAYTRSFLKIK